MADQVTVPELAILTEPANATFYIVSGGVDYQLSYDDLVKYCFKNSNYRKAIAVACNGTSGQVIAYSSPLDEIIRPIIDDYEGRGIQVAAYDENGFTIDSETVGVFGYLTMPDV